MSETDTILWVEAKRAMAQNYLGEARLRTDVFHASLDTAIHLVKLGYKLHRTKAWDKEGFFCVDISDQMQVFFDIPQ